MFHEVYDLSLEGDGGIGQGREIKIEEPICSSCAYDLDDWLYDMINRKVEEVNFTINITS